MLRIRTNFKFNQFDSSPLILILTYSPVGAEPRGDGKEEKKRLSPYNSACLPITLAVHHHERFNRENWGQVRFRFITTIRGKKTVKFIDYDYMQKLNYKKADLLINQSKLVSTLTSEKNNTWSLCLISMDVTVCFLIWQMSCLQLQSLHEGRIQYIIGD